MLKNNNKNIIKVILIIFLMCILLMSINNRLENNEAVKVIPTNKHSEEKIITTTSSKTTKNIVKEMNYSKCLSKPFNKEELTPKIKKLMNDIDTTIRSKNYNVSILYEDINTGFKYSYKPEKIFYGCSVIKIVDALYLIDKAENNNIDLDKETITYTKKFIRPYSEKLKRIPLGTKVPLRNLIDYAISISDNSAHFMLVKYIGKDNLKKYAYNLGAKQIFSKDLYGNQTVTDTNIYLKEAYRIINEDKTYGPFLKDIMDNTYYNRLSTKDRKIYHKYGECRNEYNDIGLYLGDNPYAISIFTKHAKGNYTKIVKELHEKIINLHNEYHRNRENTCS